MVDVTVPQVMKGIAEVVVEVWVSERVVGQIAEILELERIVIPQILEQSVEVMREIRQDWVSERIVAIPQIQGYAVEVFKVIRLCLPLKTAVSSFLPLLISSELACSPFPSCFLTGTWSNA